MFFFVHDISGAGYMRRGNRFTTDNGYEKRVEAKSSRFQFIAGEIDDAYLYIMCKDCLSIIKKSKDGLKPSRSKALDCPNCRKIIQKINTRNREDYKAQRTQIREAVHKARQEREKAKRQHVCARCGTHFEAAPNRIYCCKLCERRAGDSRKDHTRRLRIKSKADSISLYGLRKRDKDICWICGRKIDDSDYIVRNDGTIICGNKYPSIDHVVALANGGTHTWNNVRLAHRKCNSYKSSKMYREEQSGQLSLYI